MNARAIFYAASSLLSITGSAAAADIPGNTSTRAVLPIPTAVLDGFWEREGDDDWYRVDLRKGQAYAFVLYDFSYRDLTLRDPSGKAVKKGIGNQDVGTGLEYVAPSTGTYYLAARGGPFEAPEDKSYALRSEVDCAGDARTRCALVLGQVQRQEILFDYDVDWLRVTLRKGRVYDFEAGDRRAHGNNMGLELAVLDAQGATLAATPPAIDSGDPARRIEGFKAPATGTYYVRLRNADAGERGGVRSYSVLAKAR